MKYCKECGSEYRDDIQRCADCESSELVSAEEMHRRGLPIAGELDTRRFTRAATAEDPLTAEQLAQAVREAGIPVFSRQRQGGTVDIITGTGRPWWEILVQEDHLSRATEVVEQARTMLRSTEEEAARAAEEEEAELETVGGKPA